MTSRSPRTIPVGLFHKPIHLSLRFPSIKPIVALTRELPQHQANRRSDSGTSPASILYALADIALAMLASPFFAFGTRFLMVNYCADLCVTLLISRTLTSFQPFSIWRCSARVLVTVSNVARHTPRIKALLDAFLEASAYIFQHDGLCRCIRHA